MKINDAIFGALFVLLGVVVLVHVQAFPKIPGQQVGPALFPGLIAAGLVVCGAAADRQRPARAPRGERLVRAADWMRSRAACRRVRRDRRWRGVAYV